MPQKGTYTTLSQLKPDATDYSEIGQSIVDAELKAKADARAEEQLGMQKESLKIAQASEKRTADKDFDETYGISTEAFLKTGFNSYDEAMIPYIAQLRDEMYETKNALSKDRNNNTLKQKFNNLKTTVNTVKGANTSFEALIKKFGDLEGAGGVSGVHAGKWTDIMQKYSKFKVIPRINKENGRSEMVYMGEDGLMKTINMQDMINGQFQLYGKQDASKFANTIAERLGIIIKDSASGRFITTENTFEDVREGAVLGIQGELSTDAKLADYLNQANGSTVESWDDSTPEGKAEREKAVTIATDFLMKQVQSNYKEAKALKERAYAPQVQQRGTTEGEYKRIDEYNNAILRNQTVADIMAGDTSQLIGAPIFDVDESGAQITTMINSANVVGDQLILTLATGADTNGDGTIDTPNKKIINLKDKGSINQILNKTTGKLIDTDKLRALPNVAPAKIVPKSTVGQVAISDAKLNFINAGFVNRSESLVVDELNVNLEGTGIVAEETGAGSYAKLTAPNGKQLKVSLNDGLSKGTAVAKQVKEFIKKNASTVEGYVEAEPVKFN